MKGERPKKNREEALLFLPATGDGFGSNGFTKCDATMEMEEP